MWSNVHDGEFSKCSCLHALQTFDAIGLFVMSVMKTAQYHMLEVLPLNPSTYKKTHQVFPAFWIWNYVCYAKKYFLTVLLCFVFSFIKVGIDNAKLDGIIDDLDFTEKLISEQSVFCLPGKVKYGKFPRIPLTDIAVMNAISKTH